MTRALTITLVNAANAAVAGVICEARPIHATGAGEAAFVDATGELVFTEAVSGTTNAMGVCVLNLIPTTMLVPDGWKYRLRMQLAAQDVAVTFEMPDRDATLEEVRE